MKMKKISLAILAITGACLFSIQAFCQKNSSSADIQRVYDELSQPERDKLKEAENKRTEIPPIMEEVQYEEEAQQKHKDKGKIQKWDKKTAYAKLLRVDAATLDEEADRITYDVYADHLKNAIFHYDEDEQQVMKLTMDADNLFLEGEKKLLYYKDLEEDDFKTIQHDVLTKDISEAESLRDQAIDKQIEAFKIAIMQEEKKKKDLADDLGWQMAQADSTIEGYQKYVDEHPEGKYVMQAKNKIIELEMMADQSPPGGEDDGEEEEEKSSYASVPTPGGDSDDDDSGNEEEKTNYSSSGSNGGDNSGGDNNYSTSPSVATAPSSSGVVYRVQIIAVQRGQLSQNQIDRLYSGPEKVYERKEQGMYKYAIGNYTKFSQARSVKNSLGIQSFVVAFKDGQRIDLSQAIRMSGY